MKRLLFILLQLMGYLGLAQGPLPADLLPDYLQMVKGRHVAIVMNHASTVRGQRVSEVIQAGGGLVTCLLVPEHGLKGKADAGAHIGNDVDSILHVPVVSLYGEHKKPRPEDLAGVDMVVYDLQDVGVRFYTYISTLEYVMEACAEQHKTLLVLDRPDPNGFYVDGPVLEPSQKSFVGMQPIPVVYGMTAGEYALMLKGEGWVAGAKDLDLQVAKCGGYKHSTLYSLPVAPSPNLRTMAAVYAYPSLCLFEGTPVSVGRGTQSPFTQWGCPEFEGKFRYTFTPQSTEGATHPPYEGKVCYGEDLGNEAGMTYTALNGRFRLWWLIKAYRAYPDKEKFFTPFFTKLAGTAKLQQQVKDGMTEAQIRATWQPDLDAFKAIRKKYLLYEE